ncbi:MAG TPA: hypothetical protein DCL16_00345 [Acidimicrobiaceae bacterium]|nr:hypothetical protein [Acidimicrobiaceae bacterium]|tara:strand:+ start:668 stop:1039 length:372 start_codon:yes stop_codon:yes gene_type:complete
MTSKRRRKADALVVISWRDIPAQVLAVHGEGRETVMLPERFQNAIDRAAGVAGLTATDAYIEQWTRQEQTLEADFGAQVARTVAAIEAEYDGKALEQIVSNGGFNINAGTPAAEGRQLTNEKR